MLVVISSSLETLRCALLSFLGCATWLTSYKGTGTGLLYISFRHCLLALIPISGSLLSPYGWNIFNFVYLEPRVIFSSVHKLMAWILSVSDFLKSYWCQWKSFELNTAEFQAINFKYVNNCPQAIGCKCNGLSFVTVVL